MKNISLIICLCIAFSCKKTDKELKIVNNDTLTKSWINNHHDTLQFFMQTLLIYKKHNTSFAKYYDYKIKGDSIYLTKNASSNSNDLTYSYRFIKTNEKIELYKYDSIDVSIFTPLK